ncbi:hypothetical protein [Clostridium sp. HBUAS56010]|uniref:hypothetical protein n=1 Tax=Clostridium sp. HBUAS56010 TaxID=2571127 RepID=UPI00117816B6|nr:hypothetical protein [Clostridium sp. HBUAS56010]
MRKKKKEQHIFENSEAGEQQYLQKLKADQSMLQAFFGSFSQFYCGPFYYSYGYPMFPQTDMLVRQSEDIENDNCLKRKKAK